jgi:hypothetical protein
MTKHMLLETRVSERCDQPTTRYTELNTIRALEVTEVTVEAPSRSAHLDKLNMAPLALRA